MAYPSLSSHRRDLSTFGTRSVGWVLFLTMFLASPRTPGAEALDVEARDAAQRGANERGAEDPAPGYAFVGATVHVGDGNVFKDGVVRIQGEKIVAVGPAGEVEIPAGVSCMDAKGLHLCPGFIDLQSQLFIPSSEGRELSSSTRDRSIMDALSTFDPDWPLVRDEGVTTVAIAPGTSRGAGGLGAVMKLRNAPKAAAAGGGLLLARESHFVLALGVSGSQSTSADRLEQYYRARGLFTAAKKYRKSWDDYWKALEKYNSEVKKQAAAEQAAGKKAAGKEAEKKAAGKTPPKDKAGAAEEKKPPPKRVPPRPASRRSSTAKGPRPPRRPAVSVGLEALARAMDGEFPILIEAHRRDDVDYARLLKDEFGLNAAIVGGARARDLASELAKSGTGVVLSPVLQDENALEFRGARESNARCLHDAGVPVAIASGTRRIGGSGEEFSGLGSRWLRLHACAAVRGGLPAEVALQAITLEPARAVGLDDRLGSIAKGKHADLVLLDGDPLDARSRVVQVVVDGVIGERRSRSTARPAAAPEAREPRPAVADGPAHTLHVLRGVHVLTVTDEGVRHIENAAVHLRDGKIQRVESEGSGDVPDNATVHDLPGRWVLAGFIDAHSHVTLRGETDDVSSAVTADLRVADAFDPWSQELEESLRRGVTTVALAPGRRNVVGGAVQLVKLVPARVPLRFVEAPRAVKTSLQPDLTRPRYPTAYSGAIDSLEEWIRDAAGEAQTVLVHLEWLTQAERILPAFSGTRLRPLFVEGLTSYQDTASRQVSRIDSRIWRRLGGGHGVILEPYGVEHRTRSTHTPAVLEARGIPFAFGSSTTIRDRRDLLTAAVLAMQAGLSEEGALRSLTLNPALLYGVEDRLGRVVPGADADVVVWSDNPLSLNGRVEKVFIDGTVVFDGGKVVPAGVLPPGDGGESATAQFQRQRISTPVTTPARAAPEAVAIGRSAGSRGDVLIQADRVYPVSAPPIENGQVLVRDGKIAAVGKDLDLDDNRAVRRIRVAGTIAPGFIHGGSGIGIVGRQAEEFREMTPALPVLDAVDLDDVALHRALEAGVTAVAVTPGGRNVIGGFGGVIKTAGSTLGECTLEREAFVAASLTEETFSGNRTLRSGRPVSYLYRIPTTRMGTVFLLRRAFQEAKDDGWKSESTALVPGSALKPMLEERERDVMRQIMAGKKPIRIRADTRAEIVTALRIAREFDSPIQLEGAREALRLVQELRARKTPVFLDAADEWRGRELEASLNVGAKLAAALAAADVPFAFYSPRADVSRLRELVAWSVRYGLSESDALESVTLTPARLLGVDERVGSIDVGKDADLVAFGGEPFATTSPVLWVMVDGELVAGGEGENSTRDNRKSTSEKEGR